MADKRRELDRLAGEKDHSLAREFWLFIVENKAWWMIPLILVFGMLAVVLILGSTGAAPFIYTLF
jgi:hypothetical protein